MSPLRFVAAALVLVGVLVLVYGGFERTRRTDRTEIGPIRIEYRERQYVELPLWLGFVLVASGAVLLALPGRRAARTA